MDNEKENAVKIEELKKGIETIHEVSINQRFELPYLRREHESLREEYQRALNVLKSTKQVQASLITETNAEKAKTVAMQNNLKCKEDVRKALEKEKDICEELINKERKELFKSLDDHEDKTKEFTDIFKLAPHLYSASSLREELDNIRACANRLHSDLTGIEKEVADLRMRFCFPQNNSSSGVSSCDGSVLLSEEDQRSLKDVIKDTNAIGKTLHTLAEGDRDFDKRSKQLQQEITNALVSRDAMVKDLQTHKNIRGNL